MRQYVTSCLEKYLQLEYLTTRVLLVRYIETSSAFLKIDKTSYGQTVLV